MYVVIVDVHVEPGRSEDFVRATLDNARATRGEPGNVRFDVSRQLDDPNRFALYEVYRDQAGFEAHQRTAHYLKWRETVKDWMSQPRKGTRYRSVFPDQDGGW
jgi:autoinducer 2-degrading protein